MPSSSRDVLTEDWAGREVLLYRTESDETELVAGDSTYGQGTRGELVGRASCGGFVLVVWDERGQRRREEA